MALTVGIDTFQTVAEAESYFAGRLYAAQWTGATTEDKEKALRMAARILSRQRYLGTITSTSQLLAWPRRGVVDPEGRPVPDSTVPAAVVEAQAELALRLLEDDLTADAEGSIKRVKAGPVEVEYATGTPLRSLPDIVTALIEPFLSTAAASASSVALVP